MEYVHRFWTTIRRIVGSLSLIAAVAAHCATAEPISAAPITFAFTGTVTEIDKSVNATFDLPFTVSVGDPLSGLLTLEPVAFGDKGVAPALEYSLAGETFRAADLGLVTENNFTYAVGFEIRGPFDEIGIGCSESPSGCSLLTSTAQGTPLTDMGLALVAGVVANNGDPLAHSDFLNQFDGRQAALVFGSILNGGSISIYASFGPMQTVPEPNIAVLIAIGFCIGAIFSGRRFSDRTHKID